MKSPYIILSALTLLCVSSVSVQALPDSGFFLPDSVTEMRLNYRTVDNLIVLPVVINDSVSVNLILDTGCRNLVLFGKRFERFFSIHYDRKIYFSGLGNGKPASGALSLFNKVSISQVLGEQIPVVVVPDRNLFSRYKDVDGVIGYEIFLKFEIEINPVLKIITFRPAMRSAISGDFTKVDLEIADCRPVIKSHLSIDGKSVLDYDLMIDTGSVLGLLIKTTDADFFQSVNKRPFHARGFNGPLSGCSLTSKKLTIGNYNFMKVETGVIVSTKYDHASLGMSVLKDYIVVINYYKSYVGFRSINAV
jgi:hypothetical protein